MLASQDDIDFFTRRFINDESDIEDEWEFEGIPLSNIFDIINEIYLKSRLLDKKDV